MFGGEQLVGRVQVLMYQGYEIDWGIFLDVNKTWKLIKRVYLPEYCTGM